MANSSINVNFAQSDVQEIRLGGENMLESGNIVCGNPKLFKELLKIVNQNLGDVK